jgi:hypothetical protein
MYESTFLSRFVQRCIVLVTVLLLGAMATGCTSFRSEGILDTSIPSCKTYNDQCVGKNFVNAAVSIQITACKTSLSTCKGNMESAGYECTTEHAQGLGQFQLWPLCHCPAAKTCGTPPAATATTTEQQCADPLVLVVDKTSGKSSCIANAAVEAMKSTQNIVQDAVNAVVNTPTPALTCSTYGNFSYCL